MKIRGASVAGILLSLQICCSHAAVLYVRLNSANPTYPYTSWATAATNIQAAVDAANAGDQIIVSNGVYSAATRISPDGTTNRVVLTNAIILQSLNGAAFTIIDGGSSVRCLYATKGCVIDGFSLNFGKGTSGGGVYCSSTNVTLKNCTLSFSSAVFGGGAYSGTLTNCTLSQNSVSSWPNGAGAYNSILVDCKVKLNSGCGVSGSRLENCTVSDNLSLATGACGGGAYNSTLNSCIVSNNRATMYGGGVYNCTLTNCSVLGNRADFGGGGADGGTLRNCVISSNSAPYSGGVSGNIVCYSCLISGNSSTGGSGGGGGTLNNCTIVSNSTSGFDSGGGTSYGVLNNCIVYYNTGGTGGSNTYGSVLHFCCTPEVSGGGNFTNAPLFAIPSLRLQSNSPCINTGSNIYVGHALDLDGYLRIAGNSVDIGAYEFQPAVPLTVSLQANLTNVPPGYPVNFSGFFSRGRNNSWTFGDGTVVSNALSTTHSWNAIGDYPVALTVYDTDNPLGVSAMLTVRVNTQIVYYVRPDSVFSVPPYDSWNTAATNIQDAIDLALPVTNSLVLVSNGTYQTGGRIVSAALSNRVVINKTITVRSVNGPAVTIIRGNTNLGPAAVRCVYLTNNAVLDGFTLTGGGTQTNGNYYAGESGGGLWCESTNCSISNCIITANSAYTFGGGVYGGALSTCTISGNKVLIAETPFFGNGGGVSSATLNRCTLSDNFAIWQGGGADKSFLTNCILLRNRSARLGGGAAEGAMQSCIVTGNSAEMEGGGLFGVWNRNSTITGNSAGRAGGGVKYSMSYNSIIYYNRSIVDPNFSGYSPSGLSNCCTFPFPEGYYGNIISEPELTDSGHIALTSPCIGAGDISWTLGTDTDGDPWLNPPSIGTDEIKIGPVTDPLIVAINPDYTNLAAGYVVNLAGIILGHAKTSVWNFGDGTSATNQLYTTHAWNEPGDYPLSLRAYNDAFPSGVASTVIIHVASSPVHYVSAANISPAPPYNSWSTAATNIQDAIDAAYTGGTVIVTNGSYQSGGKVIHGMLTNRVAIYKPLRVQSVNGPDVTSIVGFRAPATNNGDMAVRCVYMSDGASLGGFTLINGGTRAAGDVLWERTGGGLYAESLLAVADNCVLKSNTAADSGGGAFHATLANCVISSCVAPDGAGISEGTLISCVVSNNAVTSQGGGGGAKYSNVTNSLLVANYGFYGGGVAHSTVDHSIICSNSGAYGGGVVGGTLVNCQIMNNVAANTGGGAYSSSLLNNCLLARNSATNLAGGVYLCILSNCTLTANYSAATAGGAVYSGLSNCIVYDNISQSGAINFTNSELSYCCAWPLPANGPGNFTNAPRFLNPAAGDFRLQANSPCINGGNNAFVSTTIDLANLPRIIGGTVDVGAYEYQGPGSIAFYWLQLYGLPTDGSVDFADSDGDGMNNWQEWRANTNPTNSTSFLKMLPLACTNNSAGIQVSWLSANGVTYFLQQATNLTPAPAFLTIASNITSSSATATFIDASATNRGPYFYRAGVQ